MISATTYAVLSITIDAPMEPGVAVFDGNGDPYAPVAEADFYCDGTEGEGRYDAELAALGFHRVGDWDRDHSGYRMAAVARAEGEQ